MARKIRRDERRSRVVKPRTRTKLDLTTRPKTRAFITRRVAATAVKFPLKKIIQTINEIERRKVRAVLSPFSPHPCKAKKARARHEYLSMVASGKGSRNKKTKHQNRFTVRC